MLPIDNIFLLFAATDDIVHPCRALGMSLQGARDQRGDVGVVEAGRFENRAEKLRGVFFDMCGRAGVDEVEL